MQFLGHIDVALARLDEIRSLRVDESMLLAFKECMDFSVFVLNRVPSLGLVLEGTFCWRGGFLILTLGPFGRPVGFIKILVAVLGQHIFSKIEPLQYVASCGLAGFLRICLQLLRQ